MTGYDGSVWVGVKAVVERAPLEDVLHQTNNLDTLGFGEKDSKCRF